MRPFVIRVLVFTLIMLFVFKVMEVWISDQLRSSGSYNYYDFERSASGQMSSDLVVLGSSRAFVHYDPSIIEDSTSLSSYNLSIDGGCQSMQFAIWKNLIINNPTPSVVVQNVEYLSFGKRKTLFEKERYLPYLGEDHFYQPLSEIDSALWQDRYVPMFRYHGHWSLIQDAIGNLRGHEPSKPYDLNKGHKYREAEFDGPEVINDFSLQEDDIELGKKLLEEVVNDCEASGSQLILCYAPEYSGGESKHNPQVDEVVSIYQETAAHNDHVEFWDLRDMEISNDKVYFADRYHLNTRGAELFSQEVGHRLKAFLQGPDQLN